MFKFRTDTGQVSGIDMFQQVYDMCTAHPKPYTEALLQAIGQFLVEHSQQVLQSILAHDDILASYAREWRQYRTATQYLNIICDYLNRMLAKMRNPFAPTTPRAVNGQGHRMSVEALAFHLWKERVLLPVQDSNNRLTLCLLDAIRRDRDGEVIQNDVVVACIESLVCLDEHTHNPLRLYVEQFEKPYLWETRVYHRKAAITAMSTLGISAYMRSAEQRLSAEAVRTARYCNPSSSRKVIAECELQYISAHMDKLQAEFKKMLESGRLHDCTCAYRLLSRVTNGVKPLLHEFEQFIVRRATELVESAIAGKNPQAYVDQLIELHAQYLEVTSNVFANDPLFAASMDKAFRTVVNNPTANAPELLARYCDMLLKKTAKGISERDIEQRFDAMVLLY
ncbi:Cullin-2 [Gaertneriomyces sp. JEL0708]|nr:Cullin-2 [Gaertneriomyces sp. JEL0708]